MPDDVLVRDGPVAVPLSYTVPQSGEMLPLMVRATLDGTAAAGPFYAAVQIVAPSGRIMGNATSSSIAAGASADVTWFPYAVGVSTAASLTLVGARIYDSGIQTIPNSTRTDITFDTIDFDTAGMVNLGANNRILTATVAGYYLVIASLDYAKDYLGKRALSLRLNGYYSSQTGTGIGTTQVPVLTNDTQPLIAPALVFLNAGDFVSVGTRQTSGGNVDTGAVGPEQKYSHTLSAVLVAS